MGEDLHHVMIIVDDINRNMNVFKNLLGFTVEWHREVDLSELHGIPGTKAEVVYLRRSAGGVAVEFVRYIRSATTKEEAGRKDAPRPGSVGISLVVKDLDGLSQRMAQEGFAPEAPPARRNPPGEGALRIGLFRAKEGWIVELIERATNSDSKKG